MSDQHYLELEGGTHLKTERPDWSKKELKSFTFEIWFCPREEKGILLSSSDCSLMLMYRSGRFSCIVNKNKLAPETEHRVKLNCWQHVCLSLNPKEKRASLFHDGKLLLSAENIDFTLKKVGKQHLLVAPEFKGSLTEVRLWRRAKEIDDVKANINVPLSVVSEKGAAVIITVKRPSDSPQNFTGLQEDFDFGDLGLGDGDTSLSGPSDNWNFGDFSSRAGNEGQESFIDSGIAEKKIGGDNDRWGISGPKEEVITPKDSLALRQEQSETIISLFGKFKFLPTLSSNDSLESQYQSQFSSISNQSAFLQKLSSLYLLTIKKSRSSYLRDDFDSALHLIEKIFSLVKEVFCLSPRKSTQSKRILVQRTSRNSK